VIVTVTKARSEPSALSAVRSAASAIFAAGPGGLDDVLRPFLTVLVGHDLQFAGLVFHVIPAEPILQRLQLLPAERPAVEEKLRLVARSVDETPA
jgi:hypothetical protein